MNDRASGITSGIKSPFGSTSICFKISTVVLLKQLFSLHFKEIHRQLESSQVASEHTLHHQNDIQHGLFKIRFSISFHSESAAGVLTSHEVNRNHVLWNIKKKIQIIFKVQKFGFKIVLKSYISQLKNIYNQILSRPSHFTEVKQIIQQNTKLCPSKNT